MLKRLYTLLIAVVMVLGLSNVAHATPKYYTFTGTTFTGADGAGALAAAGLNIVGITVSYTFMVDTAANGYFTQPDGTTNYYTDTSTFDYFYTDLVSTHPIVTQNSGFAAYKTKSYLKKFNYGAKRISNNYTIFFGATDTGISYVRNPLVSAGNIFLSMNNWIIGTTGFKGYTKIYENNGVISEIHSNLTLNAISTTNPYASAPEPSTLLLLGSGLVGLVLVRRRFIKA